MTLNCRNFTLIEIVAVMMIFALVIGVAITSYRQIPAFASMEQIITDLKQQCAEARRTASCQSRNVNIWYDPEKHGFFSEEGEIILPDDMNVKIGTQNIRDDAKKHDVFVFFPDGSGQAQSVKFERGTDTITVVLSPLTGRIVSQDGKAD